MISSIPARWRYGDAGDRYPVQPGEVWQVGPHVLACGDLEQGALADLLTHYRAPAHCYVDPPWTPALATGFRTKAGVPARVDFAGFLTTLLRGLLPVNGYLAMEMGQQYTNLMCATITALGGHPLVTWPITYYRKHPATLTAFSWIDRALPSCNLATMDDAHTPAAWIAALPAPHTILDPLCGVGWTAVAAHRAGWQFLGMELHPRRLACALEALSQAGAGLPQRVGQFWTPQ